MGFVFFWSPLSISLRKALKGKDKCGDFPNFAIMVVLVVLGCGVGGV